MSTTSYVEKLKEKIGDITECSICMRTMRDPRVLPCGHSFCLLCLQTYGKGAITTDNSIKCPLCRKPVTLDSGGFEALPISHFINKLIDLNKISESGEEGKPSGQLCDVCLATNLESVAEGYCAECRDYLCCACVKRHRVQKFLKSHNPVALESKPSLKDLLKMSVSYCEIHPTQEITLYCSDCQETSCVDCHVNKHKEHKCADVQVASNDVTRNFDKNVVSIISEFKTETENTLAEINVAQRDCEQQIQDAEKLINSKHEEMKASMASQHKQLIDQLNEKRTKRLKELEILREESEYEFVMMMSLERDWNEMKAKGSACDIIKAAETLNKTAEELIARHEKLDYDNCEKAKPGCYKIEFIAAEATYNKAFYLIGHIEDNVNAEWPSLLQNFRLNKVLSGGASITGLTIYNKELFAVRNGSPNIEVYKCSNLKTLSREINVSGLWNARCIVFCSSNNCFYVSNQYSAQYIHRIDVNSSANSGWLVKSGEPWGLSITGKQNLLVSIYSAARIEEYNTTGALVRSVQIRGDVRGIYHAVELKTGRFALTEISTSGRMLVTDLIGNILQTYGVDSGSSSGRLNQAMHIEADASGNLLISEYRNSKLIILSENLRELGEIKLSDQNSLIAHPTSFTSDRLNRRLLVGTLEGSILSIC